MGKPLAVLVLLLSVAVLAACGSKIGALGGTQYHTPLQCLIQSCVAVPPVAEYKIPSSTGMELRITSGPDGNIWIAEGDANLIARVTLSGAITEYAVPTPGALPGVIAAGPDGALWFDEW